MDPVGVQTSDGEVRVERFQILMQRGGSFVVVDRMTDEVITNALPSFPDAQKVIDGMSVGVGLAGLYHRSVSMTGH